MRKLGAVLGFALVALSGCELDLLSPKLNNTNNNGGCGGSGCGGTPTPSATPPGGALCSSTPITCERKVNPGNGLASSFVVTHGCGPAAVVTATRASDGVVSTSVSASGSTIDPGPSGTGGGVWTVTVAGAPGACAVTLDS